MRLCRAWLFLALAAPVIARAQQPGYIALDDPALPLFEFLVARGDVVDPTPQVRPLRTVDAIRALRLARVDTNSASGRIVEELERRWAIPADSTRWVADLEAGAESYTSGRRDLLHPAGEGASSPYASAGAWLAAGPFAVGSRAVAENRLNRDPDWIGDSAQRSEHVPLRVIDGWITASWSWGSVHYGQIDRAWGPQYVDDLALDNQVAYAQPDLALEIHHGAFRAGAVVQSLRGTVDTTGAVQSRTFMAHRIDWTMTSRAHAALWETVVIGGTPDSYARAAAAAAYPAALLAIAGVHQNDRSVILGGDVTVRVARHVQAAIQAAIRRNTRDSTSASLGSRVGANIVVTGAASRAALWIVSYSRVPPLLYAAPSVDGANAISFVNVGVGLVQTVTDNDRLDASVAIPLHARWMIQSGVALQRQGSDRLTDPYNPDATFLDGVVEQTRELHASIAGRQGIWGVQARAAMQIVRNANNIAGSARTRFEGSVVATVGWRWHGTAP